MQPQNTKRNAMIHFFVRKQQIIGWLLLSFLLLSHLLISVRVLTQDPPIHADEVFFTNVTQNYVKTGRMFMSLYGESGIGQEHIRTLTYPPVYFFLLAIWSKLFGTTIAAYRFFSVVVSLGTLLLLYELIKKLTKTIWIPLVSVGVIFFSSQFQIASRMTRMEMLVLFFTVSALYFLVTYFKNTKRTFLLTLSLGCAIAALFTHPLGLIALGITLLAIVFFSPKLAIKYGLGSLISILVIGALWIGKDWQLFGSQLASFVSYKTNRHMLLLLLAQGNSTWGMYTFLLVTISSLGMYIGIKAKEKLLVAFSLSALIAIIAVTITREQWYFLYLAIMPIVVGGDIIKKVPRIGLPLVLAILIIHVSWFVTGTGKELSIPSGYQSYGEAIGKLLPKNTQVVFSVLPDPYFALTKRSDLGLWEVPNISEKEKLNTFLQTKDFAVVNHFTNPYFKEYVTNHAENVTEIAAAGQKVLLIELSKNK